MKKKYTEFIYCISAESTDLPIHECKEFAFWGRSNVGKSTLINEVTKRKHLCRTSSRPGCTTQINFFKMSEEVMLVDMPGYGFAQKSKKDKEIFKRITHKYLYESQNLSGIFLLIDSRRGMMEKDIDALNTILSYKRMLIIVFTKIDKIKLEEYGKMYRDSESILLSHNFPQEIMQSSIGTSSVKSNGIKEIQNIIFT